MKDIFKNPLVPYIETTGGKQRKNLKNICTYSIFFVILHHTIFPYEKKNVAYHHTESMETNKRRKLKRTIGWTIVILFVLLLTTLTAGSL